MTSDMIMTIGMYGMKKTIKRKRVLILGANGMLGSMVYFFFIKYTDHKIVGTYNKKKIHKNQIKFNAEKFLEKKNYYTIFKNVDYVINCIGLIKPDTINNTEKAIKINSLFPYALEKSINKNCKVFQINTDCVFSGSSKIPYNELSEHDPLDVYGKTKSLGEINSNKFINIRTSIIGPEPSIMRKSLYEWFISQKTEVRGFINHFWNGITTYEYAKILNYMINENYNKAINFNISYVKKISKYDLLRQINKIILNGKKNIVQVSTNSGVNRVLASNYSNINKKIAFSLYKKNIVAVEDMLTELKIILNDYYEFYK